MVQCLPALVKVALAHGGTSAGRPCVRRNALQQFPNDCLDHHMSRPKGTSVGPSHPNHAYPRKTEVSSAGWLDVRLLSDLSVEGSRLLRVRDPSSAGFQTCRLLRFIGLPSSRKVNRFPRSWGCSTGVWSPGHRRRSRSRQSPPKEPKGE